MSIRALEFAQRLPRAEKIALGLCAFIGLGLCYSLIVYMPIFGGDPEIHIIFAKNLLAGYPLQFNPGDASSGETSPLYMVIVALFYELMGRFVPIAMKAMGVAGIFGIAWVIRREARREGASAWMALALGLLPLLLPSMTAQAQLGMENAPFAFALLAFLQAWMNRTAKTPTGLMLALGLPALFFFRPEAVLLGGGIGLVILANRDWKNLGYILLGGAIAGTIYFMIEWATGAPLQAAGELRAEISRISSIAVSLGASTIYLNPKPIIAIAYTSPFALLLFFHRKRVVRDEWIMLFALYLLPLILHVLNVFPSVHFSRYFMYAYAAFFYVFARVMARKPATTAHAAAVAAAALLIGVTLVPYEQFTRSMQGRSLARDTIAALDPAFKKTMSERYFELLGHPATPIVVATVEPQSRLFLDDRFVLRSLDGIVDYKLGAFVREGWIDYLGYLKSRHVDFIVSYPAYSRDPNHFRLPDVIEGGGDYARDGVCFHRLGMMPQLRFLQPVYAVHYGTACQAARR